MTSEEKLRKVLDARGYIVVATDKRHQPNDVISGVVFDEGVLKHPFAIVCETTREDAEEHCQIIGLPMRAVCRYYYRATTD